MIRHTLALLCCAAWLRPSLEAADADGEDMVALRLDLPPDVQRMFEEMCELEGISPSAMLTRWIDARWDAMGYTDADLEGFNMSNEELACHLEGRCGGDTSSSGRTPAELARAQPPADSTAARPKPVEAPSREPPIRQPPPASSMPRAREEVVPKAREEVRRPLQQSDSERARRTAAAEVEVQDG